MDNEPLGHEQIAFLARQAGLNLRPEHLDELVDAYGHVRRMVARIAEPRPRGNEPAHVFDPTRFATREG